MTHEERLVADFDGTGMTVGASRGNTGPGTGSDAMEAEYASRDFEGSTPGTTNYEGGGETNERGQLANQEAEAAENSLDPAIDDSGFQQGTGQTVIGDTRGLGDDDTDAYRE